MIYHDFFNAQAPRQGQMAVQNMQAGIRNINVALQRLNQRVAQGFQAFDRRLLALERAAQATNRRIAQMDGRRMVTDANVAAIDRRLGRIERQLGATDRRLRAVEGGLRAVEGRLRGVEGGIAGLRTDVIGVRNRESQMFNRRRYEDAGQHHLPLHPLLSVRARNGAGIPGRPRLQRRQPVPIGAAFPSPPFPASILEVFAMTMAQIHQLAAIMNDDFGIVRGDNVVACRAKVLRAITGR